MLDTSTSTSTSTVETRPTLTRSMAVLVTGGTGVLGRALRPLAEEAGHRLRTPTRRGLDLFDRRAVTAAMHGIDAVIHLATPITPPELLGQPDDWQEHDRLRSEASWVLVDAALDAGVSTYIQPTVTFVYPADRPADEDIAVVAETLLLSALPAERETERFARAGRRGVVLRLGLLDGPGTGNDQPNPMFGATLHVTDAGRALLAALTVTSGIYNVCRDGELVSNRHFSDATGWHPQS